MNILVTGGAGYIGSQTVRSLMANGANVVVLDRLDRDTRDAVGRAELVVGDCRDQPLVRDLLDAHRIEAVVHFAAEKSVPESVARPDLYFDNNIGGTITVLRAMVDAGVSRFVFSSSCAVYGTPVELPVTESTQTLPASPYGESKLAIERMLGWLDSAGIIRSVSLRYFNAAGADPSGDFGEVGTGATNLVPAVLRCALGQAAGVTVFGDDYETPDGTALRDFVHVVDLAEAHIAALRFLEDNSESAIVNVGTGRPVSVAEVIRVARMVTGAPIPVHIASRRAGDIAAIWASTQLAEQLLGWQARFGIEDMITSAWEWYRRHPTRLGPAQTTST